MKHFKILLAVLFFYALVLNLAFRIANLISQRTVYTDFWHQLIQYEVVWLVIGVGALVVVGIIRSRPWALKAALLTALYSLPLALLFDILHIGRVFINKPFDPHHLYTQGAGQILLLTCIVLVLLFPQFVLGLAVIWKQAKHKYITGRWFSLGFRILGVIYVFCGFLGFCYLFTLALLTLLAAISGQTPPLPIRSL